MCENHKPFHLTTNFSTTFEMSTSAIQDTFVTAKHPLFVHILPPHSKLCDTKGSLRDDTYPCSRPH